MAADNHTTIVGNLVEDPEVRFTNTGIAVTNLRVAVTQRVQQDGQWRDGDTSFFKVNVWRGQAESLAESLGKEPLGVPERLLHLVDEVAAGLEVPGLQPGGVAGGLQLPGDPLRPSPVGPGVADEELDGRHRPSLTCLRRRSWRERHKPVQRHPAWDGTGPLRSLTYRGTRLIESG